MVRKVEELKEFVVDKPRETKLPGIISAKTLVSDESVILPSEVIKGLLHRGCKAVLGANSKARKTWALLDMAIAVASGKHFWHFETVYGKVLVIDFELHLPFIRNRIKTIAKAKGVSDLSNIDVWPLRGHASQIENLLPDLLSAIERGKYSLIILDPVYKLNAGKDENSAGVIGELCNQLEQLTKYGAALVYAAHFAKGNASGKESIDRISGSGATGRDADSLITLTKHEQDGAFVVEMTLRNHPEQEPFVVEWCFPLMVERPNLDPTKLKQIKPKKKYTIKLIVDELNEPLIATDWCDICTDKYGMSERTFYNLVTTATKNGIIKKTDDKYQKL